MKFSINYLYLSFYIISVFMSIYLNNIFYLIIMLCFTIFYMLKDKNYIELFKWNNKHYKENTRYIIFFFVLLIFSVCYEYKSFSLNYIKYKFFEFLLIVFLVPFIEELIFRVILFESIKVNEEFHFILLNSFQTLIFIMIHFIVNKGYYGILVINLAYINGQIYFTEKNFLKMYGLHSIYNFITLIFTIQW